MPRLREPNWGLAWLREGLLMARSLLAIFGRSTDKQRLIDADFALDLSRNKQLSASSLEDQEQNRREYAATLDKRLGVLRRNISWSFVILASAVALSVLFSHVMPTLSPSGRAWLGASSIFIFAWATLAKLGWPAQSWSGETVVERFDERIFKFLYWLGTFLGILAIV